MTGTDRAGRERPAPVHQQMVTGAHLRQGYDALATMLSAVLVFGLPSWWLSEALGQVWIIPVGLVLGMAAAITTIWVRYGVGAREEHPPRTARAAALRAAGTHPADAVRDGG